MMDGTKKKNLKNKNVENDLAQLILIMLHTFIPGTLSAVQSQPILLGTSPKVPAQGCAQKSCPMWGAIKQIPFYKCVTNH